MRCRVRIDFFLTYLPIAGIIPMTRRSRDRSRSAKDSDRYLNALHYADASFGAFLEGLRARGLYRENVVCHLRRSR